MAGTPVRDRMARTLASKKDDSRPKQYWTARGFFGTAADLLAVFGALVTGITFFVTGSLPGAIMAITLAGLAVAFMVFSFRLQRRFSHESKRAQASRVLARCHANLRNAVLSISRGDEERFAADFFKAAQALAESYGIGTSNACRVAVKDLGAADNPEEGQVKTLCRSHDVDDDSREAGLPEFVLVKDNTDYLDIIRGAPEYFSNDLSKEDKYMNSHFTSQMLPHEFPYRSTIVWPIKGPPLSGAGAQRIIGFLCVDAEEPRTFLKRLDAPVGRAVAHAMYASLSLYRARREPSLATPAENGD